MKLRCKLMKTDRGLLLATAVVASHFVLAPAALAEETSLDARALASAEAIFDFCTKVSPADADKLRQGSQLLTQGVSQAALEKLRKGDEYQAARDSVVESLAKVDEKNAAEVCSRNLPRME